MSDEWTVCKFSDVASYDKSKNGNQELPYVGLEDIESNTGRFLGSLEPQSVKSSTFHFTPNHILYGRLRPYLNKVLFPSFEGHCSSEIFPIKVEEGCNRRFLFHWLMWPKSVALINATSTGARMPRANMKKVLDFLVPLPPITEQKRIVVILDEAFEAIDRTKEIANQNVANARELFDSYLNQVFTENVKGWEGTTLGDVCKFENGDRGSNYPKKVEYVDSGIPWINTGHIQTNGSLDRTKMNYITEQKYNSLRSGKIQLGDLVYCLRGATLGKTAIVDPFDVGAVASSLEVVSKPFN